MKMAECTNYICRAGARGMQIGVITRARRRRRRRRRRRETLWAEEFESARAAFLEGVHPGVYAHTIVISDDRHRFPLRDPEGASEPRREAASRANAPSTARLAYAIAIAPTAGCTYASPSFPLPPSSLLAFPTQRRKLIREGVLFSSFLPLRESARG